MYLKGENHAHLTFLFLVLLMSLVAALQSPFYAVAAEEERLAKLIEGAKKEGKLSVYTGESVTSINLMIKSFRDKYPVTTQESEVRSQNPE